MRIAQVVDSLEVGGLERMALDLAVEQHAAGSKVGLYCILREGALSEEARSAGIPVFVFDKQAGFALGLPARLAKQFYRDRIQVMHSHNPGIHHYAAAASRLAGVQAVINTRHGPLTSSGQPFNEERFKMSLVLTDEVVFVSEQSRRAFLAVSGVSERRTSVIPNGIRVDQYIGRPATPGAALPQIRFGTVGRLAPAKDHAGLIDAFALVLQRAPGATLSIAGDGPLMADLQAQVSRLGLERAVTLAGFQSDVASFLRCLDIFVCSSKNEGLPMAILEAMAAGLPIVSTRVGGVPEVVPEGEVGWFCPIGEPTALADAMWEAAASPELAARSGNARRRAVAHYSTAAMHAAYDAVYRKYLY